MEKIKGKSRKLYAAFMDLEKAYDRVDRMALWDVLGMYGVGRCLLEGIKAFYKGASVCVRVDGRLRETFDISVGVRQGCVMSPWLFNVHGWLYKRDECKSGRYRCRVAVGRVGVVSGRKFICGRYSADGGE